jgi:cold shock CspA family protein
MKGKVKFFREGRYQSFGFIATDYGTDFHFNLDGMKDQWRLPKAGDRVRFEPVEHENGIRAVSIEILSGR